MNTKIKFNFRLCLLVIMVMAVVLSKAQTSIKEYSGGEITGQYQIPAHTPDWVHKAVFYQIYPQSFYDSNGDGIGDLQGILQKLDYIKSLGIDAIWINPFFDSPFLDAGYDIRNYFKIASRYGTNEDAKTLFAEAHKKGMKILFDFVTSYTSIENPWFKESAKGQPNKYSNWYIWTNNTWVPEDKFCGKFIQGYSERNGMFMRNFFWSQPAVNFGFGNPDTSKKWQLPCRHPDVMAVREEMKKVCRFWLDLGADGFRADMANELVKGEDPNRENVKFWQEIREMLNTSYPNAFIISEWSKPTDALDNAFHADFFHWVGGYRDIAQAESWRILDGFSDGFSYFDREGKGNMTNFLDKFMPQYSATKSKGYISVPFGNHDIARINVNRTTDELEMIAALGITLPGIPFIYYGNEIGMKQLYDLPQIEGSYNPRAGARSPMQWTAGKNLGFSTAASEKLWLPVDTAVNAPTVQSNEKDKNSLLNRIKKLISLKHSEPALAAYSEFTPLYAKTNTYPFVFSRANGKDIIVIIMNPIAKTSEATFDVKTVGSVFTLLAGKKLNISKSGTTVKVKVEGQSYAIYKLKY